MQVSHLTTNVSVSVMYMISFTMVDISSMPIQSDHTQWLLNNHSEAGLVDNVSRKWKCGPLRDYGASNVLQEILIQVRWCQRTFSLWSDYQGKPIPKPGVPESFRVLVVRYLLNVTCVSWTKMIREVELRDLDDVIHVDDEKAHNSQEQNSLWCWRIRKISQ